VTVLYCTNKTGGHKLKPLCFGKNWNLQCFKCINVTSLPVNYKSSKKPGWLVIFCYHCSMKSFSQQERICPCSWKLNGKAPLLLDNCLAHPPPESQISKDIKIVVMFLRKDTATLIQPLDQGIIQALLKHIIGGHCSQLSLTQGCKCHSSCKQLHLRIWPTLSDWHGKTLVLWLKNWWSKSIAARW
jgi:hypothetical protein